MNIGKRVTDLRERAKISKYRLAQIIGVDPSLITRIEKNEAKPSLDSLERICAAVGVSLAEFFSTEHSGISNLTTKIKNLTGKTGEVSIELIKKLREPGVMDYIMQNEIPKLRAAYAQVYGEDNATVKMDNLHTMLIDEQINFILQFCEDIKENHDGSYTLIVRGSKDATVRRLMEEFNSLSESDRQFVLLLVDRLKHSSN